MRGFVTDNILLKSWEYVVLQFYLFFVCFIFLSIFFYS